MSGDFLELRQAAAAATRLLAGEQLVVQAFGNASQVDRREGVFAIKPSGIPCQAVSADDMVVVALGSGNVVWGDNRPSADTPTHRIIYEGLDGVGGVAHTHSLSATAWAQARREIPCLGTTHADHFRGAVPVTRALEPHEIEAGYEESTGRAILEMYGPDGLDPEEAPGALVASHGPFTWGVTATEAVQVAAAVELMADLALRTLAIAPDVGRIDEALLDKHFTRKHGPTAYYGQR